MANSDLAIGRLALTELPDAEALVAEAGWNQVAADWRMFLDFGTAYAVRAQGRVVASAAWISYGACAWISMVLVTAGERRRGLATRLLHRCISDVTAVGLVPVLDATPAGATVYAPLGFKEAWGFARFAAERHVVQPAETSTLIEPIADDAWSALCAYDATVFGNDRSQILARMRGRLPPANLLARRGGRIVGMLLGREGRTASHLGPLIAEDDATALALLRRALNGISGTVYIDIADAKGEVRRWLEASGFAQQRPFTRMLLGRSESFDDLARTFAVIGPEFG
ncbi:MAG: GNAT family N-acetyltransferase [Xanthobacteraceae bacterium]